MSIIATIPKIIHQQFTDQQLLVLCEKYGLQARLWRQKFLGLLPEVCKRRLYEKKGCGSIFEFAKKMAGISEEQVRMVLNLEKRFEDKPVLHQALVEGQVSVNKLARIASIATQENEADLAEQVAMLPNRAVETFVKDYKIENGLEKTINDDKSLHVQTLQLSWEVQQKLLELQRKGIDINQLILEMLEKRDGEIQEEKEKLAQEAEAVSKKAREAGHQIGRHISEKIKRLLGKEFGKKCAVPHCAALSLPIHHTARFSLVNSHNPFFLAPLCEEHHVIAHSIDVKFQENRLAHTVSKLDFRGT